ncbi:MAG TPA: efflux RND transporter periplasmic adaptor subunit [Bryobacteraceae bacterium]|nr:efflux RND transporter periplasmic adaptor subunit [Bryobacteraceae bacterium]
MTFPVRLPAGVILVLIALIAAACQSTPSTTKAAGALPPAPVTVLEIAPENVAIYSEYTAQTFARDMVEVRGRVDGFIEKRLFQVGADVKAGEVLYELDLRPYQADVAKSKGDVAQSEANREYAQKQVALIQAQADLAQAQANLLKAKQDVDRLRPLVKEEAAAQQDLDNALAALQANEATVNFKQAAVEQARLQTRAQIDTTGAQVESNRAVLRNAELNLEYATIRAPIAGRVGDSLVQVGGLVTRTSPQPLTTIVPLDPIWVRFKVSEGEYLASMHKNGALNEQPLQLVLADNTTHPFPGRVQNTVNSVDQKTGTLELQATFPNPKHNLLPGQFGRVRVTTSEQKNVLLVPLRAVQDLQGLQSVFAVGPDNKVQAISIVPGEHVGERVIVTQGLKPGDRVIVEGLQKVRLGAIVNPQRAK